MLHNVRLSEEWMLSPIARRVYLICAVCSIYFFGLRIGVTSAIRTAGANELSGWLSITLRISFLPGIVGTATLWIAMWYFWLRFDNSHWAKRAAWFVLLFFVPIGPIAYYLVVYRRADFSQHADRTTRALDSSPGR